MNRVLSINDNNTATISTDGLYAVVVQATGEVIGELLSKSEADMVHDAYTACNSEGAAAEVVSYAAMAAK